MWGSHGLFELGYATLFFFFNQNLVVKPQRLISLQLDTWLLIEYIPSYIKISSKVLVISCRFKLVWAHNHVVKECKLC